MKTKKKLIFENGGGIDPGTGGGIDPGGGGGIDPGGGGGIDPGGGGGIDPKPRKKVPDNNTISPSPKTKKPEDIKTEFPVCVSGSSDFSQYSETNDGKYYVVQSGSLILFYNKPDGIQVFRDRTKKPPYNEGEWYCKDGGVEYYYYEKEEAPKPKKTNLNPAIDNAIKYLLFNPFKQKPSEVGTEKWVVNQRAVSAATKYLVARIKEYYQGIYIQNFKVGLEYVKDYGEAMNFSDVATFIDTAIKDIDTAITSAETSFQTAHKEIYDTGISLESEAQPENPNFYVQINLKEIFPWIESQKSPVLYRHSGIKTTSADRTTQENALSKLLAKYTANTTSCVASLKVLIDKYGYCKRLDKDNRFGVCDIEATTILPQAEVTNIQLIKHAVNVCNYSNRFDDDELVKFFEARYQNEKGGLFSGKRRKINAGVEFIRNAIDIMSKENKIKLGKTVNGVPTKVSDQTNESLKNTIKKLLIEKQMEKKSILTESKIIKNKFQIILESRPVKSRRDLNELYVDILSEMVILHKKGYNDKLIAENVEGIFGVLSNLLGGGSGVMDAVAQTFKEKGVSWILNKLGLSSNSYLKDLLITSLGNVDLVDIPKLFSNCDFLTEKIAESIPEAYLRQLQREKGMDGMFGDAIRNALYNTIKNSDFGEKVKGAISGIVCGLVDQLGNIFSGRFDQMKSSVLK